MNEAQKVALSRAKSLLAVAGIEWAVRLPDGTVEGTLPIAAPRYAGPKRTCVRFSDPGYIKTVESMKPGDAVSIPYPPECAGDDKRRLSFFASVRSKARRTFGADKVIVAVNGTGVDALRVE